MSIAAPQAPKPAPAAPRRWPALAAAGVLALSTAGCLGRSPTTTGSIDAGADGTAASAEGWRKASETWGPRFHANPADVKAALAYTRALRALDQNAQAVAVLQQAALKTPDHPELLAAYGKALVAVGRYKEASEVLERAHAPERPDWRILSTQGTVADNLGDHALAQQYYRSALRIAPDEPGVLSNLGLSYALARRLPEAERTLRDANARPGADARVRQNFALVLGLQGKFTEAEEVLRRDLAPTEVGANLAALRTMVSQQNSWKALKGEAGAPTDRTRRPATPTATEAANPSAPAG